MRVDMRGALDEVIRLAEPVAAGKAAIRPVMAKRQAERILLSARKRGFLVLPYRFNAAGLRGMLRDCWRKDCDRSGVPCVVVCLLANGDGRVEYHCPLGAPAAAHDTPFHLSKVLDRFHTALSEADERRCDRAMPHGGLYTLSSVGGAAAFTREIAPEVVGAVITILEKQARTGGLWQERMAGAGPPGRGETARFRPRRDRSPFPSRSPRIILFSYRTGEGARGKGQ